MKSLLLALLFANLVFFGYVRLVGQSTPPLPPAQAIPRLALLGEQAPPPGRCLSVGPFVERALVEQAGQWLQRSHYAGRERTGETHGPPDFLVTATTPTLKQAEQTVMRLKAAGVTDLGVVAPSAERPTALLQLGLYSERSHAEQRVAALRRYALTALLTEQAHKVPAWWLDVELTPTQAPFDAPAIAKAVSGATGVTVDPCPETSPAATQPPPNEPSSGPPPAKLPGSPA